MTDIIESERLQLVPANLELARAELARIEGINVDALAAGLGETLGRKVAVPGDWPPPLNDEESMAYYMDMLEKGGAEAVGWGLWFFLLKTDQGLAAAGNGGFKGPPDDAGVAELGYAVMPAQQRSGLATEAVTALMGWARGDGRVKGFIAHTLTGLTPSIRVLEKCGFAGPFPGPEDGVIRYERNCGDN